MLKLKKYEEAAVQAELSYLDIRLLMRMAEQAIDMAQQFHNVTDEMMFSGVWSTLQAWECLCDSEHEVVVDDEKIVGMFESMKVEPFQRSNVSDVQTVNL